jgi:hypothetical protein
VIKLTAELLGVDRLTAAQALNADYNLRLQFGRAEQTETPEHRRERLEIKESKERYNAFSRWVEQTETKLNHCHRIGWLARLKDPAEMTKGEALAVGYLPVIEDLSDTLMSGDVTAIMSIYTGGAKGVSAICDQILQRSQSTNENTPK